MFTMDAHRTGDHTGPMSGTTHTYRTTVAWEGSTGVGYDSYDRTHAARADPAAVDLTLASDPAFHGDPALLNPEQLLVLAASSCQLLSFLTVAARAHIDVVSYRDEAEATMTEGGGPMRVDPIVLAPVITVAGAGGPSDQPSDERLRHLCEVAHQECFIANSLRSEVVVNPTFRRRQPDLSSA